MYDDARIVIDTQLVLIKHRDIVGRAACTLQGCLANNVNVVVALTIMNDRTRHDIPETVLLTPLLREETRMVTDVD